MDLAYKKRMGKQTDILLCCLGALLMPLETSTPLYPKEFILWGTIYESHKRYLGGKNKEWS